MSRHWGFPVGSAVKNLPVVQEDGWEISNTSESDTLTLKVQLILEQLGGCSADSC